MEVLSVPSYVRLKRLWRWLPMGGIAIKPYVFIKHPNYYWILAHELVHIEQQRRDGLLLFLLKYFFVPKYRVAYEAEAYAESVRRGLRLEACATHLSSGLYLWACSYDKAKQLISDELRRV